jgi:TonB-dependent starch-binding outer membrane protein SusC
MKYPAILFACFLSLSVFGQREIKGIIKDTETKKPLKGAIVTVTNGSAYAMTRDNGRFTLKIQDNNDTILISKNDYYPEAVVVKNAQKFDVGLTKLAPPKEDGNVNIGYGEGDKKSLTSSVVELSEKDFNKGAVNNIYEFIRGKVPGLNIQGDINSPNSKPRIMFRGISSLNQDAAEPLIVIDGIPGASLDTVDPNEVAKISVLKDASAQAIYGSRAMGGVILITTKKAKKS